MAYDRLSLEGRVAVVVGGTTGIGRTLSLGLAEAGAHVVASSRREAEVESVAAEIEKLGRRTLRGTCDVLDRPSLVRLRDRTLAAFGNVDILVNCAGRTKKAPFLEVTEEDWNAVLETNLTATFGLAQAAVRPMLKQRSGRIIAISSVVGQTGNAGQTSYAASKAGLIGFAKALARELASRAITVNIIAPGMIETDMTRALASTTQADWASQIPIGRPGTPDDVAAAVCFLASDEASYITGHVLAVNGGMYM